MRCSPRVLIASPMNLLALLVAAHRGWQDFGVQEDAKKIGDLTKELYKRFSTLFDYVRKTGKGIQQSTTNYNNLIGALENNVLPTLRKLDDLNVVDGEIASIEPLETSIRELSVPEETPEIENLENEVATASKRAGACLCQGVPAIASRQCVEVNWFGATPTTSELPPLENMKGHTRLEGTHILAELNHSLQLQLPTSPHCSYSYSTAINYS